MKRSIFLDVFNPEMTLKDLSDVFEVFGWENVSVRLIPLQRDSFLADAWKRLTTYQSGRCTND